MGQLRALQEDLKRILFIGKSSSSNSSFWKGKIPDRIDVYRNNVHLNWLDTLEFDFPLTRKQFSDPDWQNLTLKYFSKHPPAHWELNYSVLPFPSFLRLQKCPLFVSELAEYEQADLMTFIHTAVVKKDLGITNPTLSVKVFQHQIFDWVESNATPEKPPEQRPEVLVFFRDSEHTLHVQEAEPLMLLMLDHFKKPGAKLDSLEPVRAKLLPQNTVFLETVLNNLVQDELILL